MRRVFLCAGTALLSATALLADFQYQQTTKITGGVMSGAMKIAGAFSKQAREPIVNEVFVQGNRMAQVSARSAQVIDLDKETITNIDFDRKQFSVTTFAQMKQAIEDAMARAKNEKSEGTTDANVSFKASVKETGATRTISNLNTKGFILTLVMEGSNQKTGEKGTFSLTNDLWMAPEIQGYQEVRDFQMRMAQKMGTLMSGGAGFNPMAMGRSDMAKAMSEAAKEMGKLKGIPVLTVSRMGTTADGRPVPPASEAPEAAQVQGPDLKEAGSKAAAGAALGRLGGLAGGLGGFGRRKKQEEPPQESPSQPPPAAGPAILMETTTESSGFSAAAVDASKFEVPAGFKQVESEFGRRR